MAAIWVSDRLQAVLTALNGRSAASTHVQDLGCADGVHTGGRDYHTDFFRGGLVEVALDAFKDFAVQVWVDQHGNAVSLATWPACTDWESADNCGRLALRSTPKMLAWSSCFETAGLALSLSLMGMQCAPRKMGIRVLQMVQVEDQDSPCNLTA